MVLDEDALEAMLKQQQTQREEAEDELKESKQTELTHRTEEFEVYERDPDHPKTGAGLRASAPPVEPEAPTEPILPEAFQDQPAAEPAPAEPQPTPQPEPPIPEPVNEPASEPVVAPEPTPDPTPEPEPVAAPVVEEEPLPERPRVWPPLSNAKDAAPVTVQEEPVPEPEPAAPDADPTPAPTPEPAATPEPTTEAVQDETTDAPDPHAHAHADLDVDGGGVRIAIVQALFNQDITDMMTDLAIAKAKKRGAKVTHHVTVPGVYDLPLVTARLLEQDDVDCAVVIGVVIQGETSHDELITQATARTLQQLSLDVDKPIGFGVIGPGMTWKQAEARVANGAHAVDAALAQVEAIKAL